MKERLRQQRSRLERAAPFLLALLLATDPSKVAAQQREYAPDAQWLQGNSLPEHPDEYPAYVTLIPNAPRDVTYAKDVAPIIQDNCVRCHRPESVAPMSLQTYEEVRPWARVIMDRVVKRQMPPWPIDQSVGITEFKNDPSLSEEQIRTIVDWVEGGAVLGNAADLPEPRQWPEGLTWQFQEQIGPPDMVFQSPVYKVVANGQDQWPEPVTPIDEAQIAGERLTTERWIRAIEVRPNSPEGRKVFHHANPAVSMPGPSVDPLGLEVEGRNIELIDSAVGMTGRIFPENIGRAIRPGSSITWNLHYHPYGEDIDAALQVALWLYPEGYKPEHYSHEPQLRTSVVSHVPGTLPTKSDRGGRFGDESDILLPPNSEVTLKGVWVLGQAAMVHSIRGHQHLRGKYQVLEAVYPDGSWETLTKLNWDTGWHTLFLYEDHVMPLLPKGTVLIATSTFDNTAENPHNPDPDQWVTGGDRSVDEMGHIRLGLTYLADEEFAELVQERQRMVANRSTPVPSTASSQ